ncbi:UV-endonuclease UvdE [Xylona heveae TC161]|uniref:UV-endonuclease UvdE n=1 Tax=Xylona heveae (strain CBS 132557 / TC161) TaxID=1328760 RepID=A0A164ZUH9_XYLHT|nr:UV-endonuclease UvdE [Xylona heveae TC161]KZF19542.1 UV-endonuclease UvdE [Xylona heveae TC161]
MAKRKRSSVANGDAARLLPSETTKESVPASSRSRVARGKAQVPNAGSIKSGDSAAVLDSKDAVMASTSTADGVPLKAKTAVRTRKMSSDLSDELQAEHLTNGEASQNVAQLNKAKSTQSLNGFKKERDAADRSFDPDDGGGNEEEADEEDVKAALGRPPPVNSSYLPLPWKGRLGYACLCTYLRFSNPAVFSSRTCRIASILEHRHPLKDPSQPEHPTKNRPDKDQPADIARGQAWVESLALANVRDTIKMIKWNDKYGIKFMRLSSEMFPFASHEEYGYKLEPFAAETLGELGKVVAQLGHRVTTHPGQYTQLGSPRPEVIRNAIRDLEYHAEMLSLLKLPPQQDRDAVMILHMGGVYGDKEASLERFRKNYKGLSQNIKNRLVLENDDVSWSVHDLLPICNELNIPLVLDYHHHNIMFDADKVREGTLDIMGLYDDIKQTWMRKGMTQKMHYSEPTVEAITPRQRRKHRPRVTTLPPCDPTMDLMIEAKDKEQAVFELMRTYRLPGWDLFNDIVPHVRQDENKPPKPAKKKASPKKKGRVKVEGAQADEDLEAVAEQLEDEEAASHPRLIPEEEVGMGGPERRVYWPPGMEDWLRPPKRVTKKKDTKDEGDTPKATPAKKRKNTKEEPQPSPAGQLKKPGRARGKRSKATPTPPMSEDESDSGLSVPLDDNDDGDHDAEVATRSESVSIPSRRSGRAKRISYAEDAD